MKFAKYFCHVLTIKDMCYIMELVRWLIFIKKVSQVVEIQKDCDKNDCNKGNRDS